MADLDPESFAAQLADARSGERVAWERLYLDHARVVAGYLRSQRVPHPDDILAEVWLQVVRDLKRFDGDEGAFRGWILRIAHNRIVDAHRATARRVEEVPVADIPEYGDVDPEPPTTDVDELERLFEGLPGSQRAVLYLRYVLDLPQREIATILDTSVAAVKMQQRRGIDAVASRLDEGVDQ